MLFICSGKDILGISPFIRSQGESLKKLGVELDYFTIDRHGILGYLRFSVRLRKHLKANEVDILHAHYGMSAWAALMARRKEKIVVSFMGDDIVGSNKPDGSVTKTSLLFARFNSFLARKFYDHVIIKSQEMRGRLRMPHVSLIPNGVDLGRFKPAKKVDSKANLGIDPRAKIVVFASDPRRLEKNYPLAQNAVASLKEKEVILLTVSQQPPESMPAYYNAADVLLLTSFHEGSPNVIKEAMACNCPVVATPVGDVEWILGKTEGCYITSFAIVDVAEKLARALDFSEEHDRNRGRGRIIELGLDAEDVARRIIEVYRRVAS
ncbi:MAG: glycosyltransferase family 4 protein [Thermodesulfovibrionales bacterium]|nr:glycosyltransferase family 4 protein [Thermodesulfovibrionales bacterium]